MEKVDIIGLLALLARNAIRENPYLLLDLDGKTCELDIHEAYQSYADSLDLHVDQLTVFQKQRAWMNYILDKYAPESEKE